MRYAFDTSELQELSRLFHRRATEMVPNAVTEAMARADAAAQRRRPQVITLRRRRVGRMPHATGPQQARWVEIVMYHRLKDFFGDW